MDPHYSLISLRGDEINVLPLLEPEPVLIYKLHLLAYLYLLVISERACVGCVRKRPMIANVCCLTAAAEL